MWLNPSPTAAQPATPRSEPGVDDLHEDPIQRVEELELGIQRQLGRIILEKHYDRCAMHLRNRTAGGFPGTSFRACLGDAVSPDELIDSRGQTRKDLLELGISARPMSIAPKGPAPESPLILVQQIVT